MQRYGLTLTELESLNPGLADPLKPGDLIKIPIALGPTPLGSPSQNTSSTTQDTDVEQNLARTPENNNGSRATSSMRISHIHEVQEGESLEQIAKKYSVDVKNLMKDNALSKQTNLRGGTLLVIKVSEEEQPTD